jgi:DNA polymerase V
MTLLPVDEVWGCGRQLTKKLAIMGIKTVLQLADSNLALIRRTFGVVLERTVRELNCESCISIDALPAKQQIIVSRSFGQRITQLQDMHQAVCQYAERAAENNFRYPNYPLNELPPNHNSGRW